MSDRARHVDALFGGAQVRFCLRTDAPSAMLTGAMLGTVYGCFKTFASDRWTLDDVRNVLRLSHPGGVAVWGEVDAIVAASPATAYAELAAAILGAHLFGANESAA